MNDQILKNANILIVDDQIANIDVIKGLLTRQKYLNILTLTDPREVLGSIVNFPPDIILLDLSMPHLSGFEVMEQLKAHYSENAYLPILVLTADITVEAKRKALSAGASDFLTKPFDLFEVNLRIRNLLFAKFLHKELQNQNMLLEERVKERTYELEQKNIELTVAKEKAEESDQLKTAFLNNISHEIRTPISGILGFLSIIQNSELTISERDEFHNIINESANRLINTVNDIIEISQIQKNQKQLQDVSIDLNSLSHDLFDFFKDIAEKKGLRFTINNSLSVTDSMITNDKKKLFTILSNIINNAIKFTLKGSIEINIYLNAGSVEFSVKDTGVGIPKIKQQTIFKDFVQVDYSISRRFEGTGLGLSIAKQYAEMLGGKLWVESEEGEGSIFYLSIPNHA